MATFVAMFAASAVVLAASEAMPPPSTAGRIQYEAAWFAQFGPRTALDMVRQMPGFVLREAEEERRGFAGAVGNVLVDGERPSAKEQTLDEILQRIPATQVERIELLRGADTAGDASGQATLINVVRKAVSGQGVWSAGVEYATQHRPAPNGYLSVTGQSSVRTTGKGIPRETGGVRDFDYALGMSSYSLRRELPGERRTVDASGNFTDRRLERSPRDFAEYAINGEASTAVWGGRARVTGQAYSSRYHEGSSVQTLFGDDVAREDNPYTEGKRTFEAGAQFQRGLASWNLDATALLTRSRFHSEVSSTKTNADGATESIFSQALVQDSGESILRGTLARDMSTTQRLELALEGAVNTLDARLNLAVDSGNGAVPIDVPNSNISIEERRSDAFVVHTWRPAARWSLETRLAGEFSQLNFAGDTRQRVELAFFKPSMQLARSFATNSQLRLGVKREVGQLDFTDFVSVASLTDNRIEGGNPDLRPQTSWSAELAADIRWRDDLTLGLSIFRQWLRDTADFVPVDDPGNRTAAPGNIGNGRIYGATITARTPLPLMPGGSLKVDATLRDSAVIDPLTRRVREISEFEDAQIKAGLRQDLRGGRWAWGFDYKYASPNSTFRLIEVDTLRESPSLDLFAEVPVSSAKLRLSIVSLLDEPELRERSFYAPTRSGSLFEIERTRRQPGRWLLVTISGGF